MVKQLKPNLELIDEDNPEWTAADFRRAQPAALALPELFGASKAAEMLRPKRGRPVSAKPKAHVNLRVLGGGDR